MERLFEIEIRSGAVIEVGVYCDVPVKLQDLSAALRRLAISLDYSEIANDV
jgi:hypothetical protein